LLKNHDDHGAKNEKNFENYFFEFCVAEAFEGESLKFYIEYSRRFLSEENIQDLISLIFNYSISQ
jgi:hypothetical protein